MAHPYRSNTALRAFLWVTIGCMALLVAVTLFSTLSIQQITGQNKSPLPQSSSSLDQDAPDINQPYLVPAGRSPLAQPGEQFTSPNPTNPIDITQTQIPTSTNSVKPHAIKSPSDPVPWDQAIHYIGQTITVQAKVVDTYFSTKDQVCFLNFTTYRNGNFYVLIFRESLNAWPEPPEKFFLNKTIRVTGKVFARANRSQIRVLQPSQISILE